MPTIDLQNMTEEELRVLYAAVCQELAQRDDEELRAVDCYA